MVKVVADKKWSVSKVSTRLWHYSAVWTLDRASGTYTVALRNILRVCECCNARGNNDKNIGQVSPSKLSTMLTQDGREASTGS